MKKIGFITIGQAPRNDIMEDVFPLLEGDVEVLQCGALDKLTLEEMRSIAPEQGDTVLVSSLRDGTSIAMGEKKIIPLLQECINNLESFGVTGILLLCTGDFKDLLTAKVPLLSPNRIMKGIIPTICDGKMLTVLVPDEEQKKEALEQWMREDVKINVIALSPYESTERDFEQVSEQLKNSSSSFVLMDCMGYSQKMKKYISERTGKNVILPRTLLAAILKEIV